MSTAARMLARKSAKTRRGRWQSLGALQRRLEALLAPLEPLAAAGELFEPGFEPVGVQRALLEGQHVPVDGLVQVAQLRFDGGQFCQVPVAVVVELSGEIGCRPFDQVGPRQGD